MASNLSPWQQYLSQLFPGKNAQISPQAFEQAANQFFGPLPVPPGSQIISQSASEVRYVDADGFEHVLRRSLDGRDPNAGKVQEISNRPAVLPNTQQQNFTQQLQQNLQQGFAQPPALAQLDPQTAQALQAIAQAEQTANNQAIQDQQGQLIAALFGRGVNQSSIASNAAAQFAQRAGLVRQQQQSDAANRELAVRNLLTTLGQQQRELQGNLYANLTGQGTQRDIASAGIDLDKLRLNEQARQTNLGFELNQQQADMALAEQNSFLNKLLKGSQIASNLAGAVGGGLSAYSALFPKKPAG